MNEKKVKNKSDVKKLPEDARIKYEIAEELGLLDKIFEQGWGSLSANETGRIGGLTRNRMSKK